MSRSLVVAATVLVLALSGCTDDPEPRFADPTETPSPSQSSPPTETTSSPPTTTDPPTPEPDPLTPEETVRAWIEAQNHALDTGNLAQASALSANDCDSCSDLLEPIADVYAAGGTFSTDGWQVIRSRVTRSASNQAEVTVAVVIAGGRTIPSAGAEPVDYPEERSIINMELSNVSGAWRVSLIGFLE